MMSFYISVAMLVEHSERHTFVFIVDVVDESEGQNSDLETTRKFERNNIL